MNLSFRESEKILQFTRRQFRNIGLGGLVIFRRKFINLQRALVRKLNLKNLFKYIISTIIILLIRILRPLLLIKIGSLRNDRIGHFAADTEKYLCEKDMGIQNTRSFDIFYLNNSITANYQLLKMFKRILFVHPFVEWIEKINDLFPGGKKHILSTSRDRDILGIVKQSTRHLYFTEEEELLGAEYLKRIGLSEEDEFICVYSRDGSYLPIVQTYRPKRGWSYHDYRNSSIENYILASELMMKKSYFVFRMGHHVDKAIPIHNSAFVDYAINGDRSDFLDIYLLAKSKFLLGAGGGVMSVAAVFRTPMAIVNYIPLEYCHVGWGENDLQIPKNLWSTKENRFMTFREIIDSGAGRFLHSHKYKELGIELVENTPEEIVDLVVEIEGRIDGTWVAGDEDNDLQSRFHEILPESELVGKVKPNIGAKFLRQNKYLLE